MKTFTINLETLLVNAYASQRDAKRESGSGCFVSEKELVTLTAEWPAARLLAVWNGLPSVKPVRKFTDRATALARIWKAIQTLEITAPEPPIPVEEVQVAVTQTAAIAEPEPDEKSAFCATLAKNPREGSKTALVLGLLKREGGAALSELMAAAQWQAHSVRGFLSGTVGKKMGLTVISTKREDGERIYSVQP